MAADILPAVAAVHRPPNPAVLAARRNLPEIAVCLPECGVNDARIVLVDADVDSAGFVADMQDIFPACAAVRRTIDAAFSVAAKGMAQGGDINQIGIVRMRANLGDLAGVFEADVLPAAPGVSRFVDPVADGNINADG